MHLNVLLLLMIRHLCQYRRCCMVYLITMVVQGLTLFRLERGGGGGLLMPAPTLNSLQFQTI